MPLATRITVASGLLADGTPQVSGPDAVRIVLFSTIGLAVNVLAVFQASFAVLLPTLEPEFGGSRTGLTIGYSAMISMLALASPFSGRLLDRYGARAVLLVSLPALIGAMSLFALIPASIPAYIGACALLGLIAAGSCQFIYFGVLPKWFDRRLGIALGLAGAGTSLGLAVVPLYTNHLLSLFGWRGAYVGLGVTIGTIALCNLLLLKPAPVRSPEQEAGSAARTNSVPRRSFWRQFAFWRLSLSYGLLFFMINGYFVHLVPMLTESGVSRSVAVRCVVYVGLSSLIARVVCGLLLVRLDGAKLGFVVFLLGTFGALALMFVREPLSATLAVLLLGITLGVEGELLNFMARRVFGVQIIGSVLGALNTTALFGSLIGPVMLSLSHDATGHYFGGQAVLIACGLIAAILHFGIKPAVAESA